MHTLSERYCIIGAGSSGLTAAKNLKEAGIAYDIFEAQSDLGGLWNYHLPRARAYRSAHLISSKPLTEFTDFPMPGDYPDYPNHEQVLAYFRAYAQHHGLDKEIQFNTEVSQIQPGAAGGWDVTLADGTTKPYAGIIIANGHHWEPKYPSYPGTFTGEVIHSASYKTPDVLEGKRVLVVGAGNSGCDIAVEAATHASKTYHSSRRGYYYMPKFYNGRPIDQANEDVLRLGLPLPVRRALGMYIYRQFVGDLSRFGVTKPDHKLYETHTVVNALMPYYVGQGDIIPKPDIQALQDKTVSFTDGSTAEVDLIVYATGFNYAFPFIDTAHLNWKNGRPGLFLNVFTPQYDNLFVAGLIQPDSGQWGLVDRQCQLIARFIVAQKTAPRRAARFRQLKRRGQEDYGGGVHYVNSTRHFVEIAHYPYRQRLEKLIKQLKG